MPLCCSAIKTFCKGGFIRCSKACESCWVYYFDTRIIYARYNYLFERNTDYLHVNVMYHRHIANTSQVLCHPMKDVAGAAASEEYPHMIPAIECIIFVQIDKNVLEGVPHKNGEGYCCLNYVSIWLYHPFLSLSTQQCVDMPPPPYEFT